MINSHNNLKLVLMGGSAAMALAVLAGPAMAQTPAAGETIVVTGSRIPTTNAISASPVSVATSAQIQETSAYQVEDILAKMVGPDNTSGTAKTTNNGGEGNSSFGLRNLGPARTLVLVDGQRLVPTTTANSTSTLPDLNSIPVAMVDRIEVLRDGASSIYGADAIGGVINIITKKNFEGLRLDAYGGTSEHGGDDTYTMSATMGVNFDKGNLTLSLLNEHETPVNASDRSWAQNAYIGYGALEGGTTYRSQLPILQDASNGIAVWNNGVETTRANQSLATPTSCMTFLPDLNRVKLNANCGAIQPSATVQGALGRTQATLSGQYDITDDITLVSSAFFTRRSSEQRIRPEPVIGASIASTYLPNGLPVYAGFQVPTYADFGFTDPLGLVNAANKNVMPCGGDSLAGGMAQCFAANLTPNQFGDRDYKQISDTYRIRIGLEGHVFTDYNWEIGYVGQRNEFQQHIYNSGNFYHFAQASGNVPCIDVPGGCTATPDPRFGYVIPLHPINFFNLSSITPDQWAYLKTTLQDTAFSSENFIYGDVNGPIFELPYGTVQGSLGFERRFENAATFPDSLAQEGYSASQSSPTAGGYGVYSFYGELRVPVLKDLPLAQSLVFTPSARYDHYSTFGDATTYKLGADWQVWDELRFRGSYNTGFRAPNINELYGGSAVSFIGISGDPCDTRVGVNGNVNAGLGSLASGSACYKSLAAIGLSPAQIASYQSPENNLKNDQRGFIVGGNPTLSPEKSHSWTVGAVVTPDFMPGFNLNVDYYEITITNSILDQGVPLNLPSTDQFITDCFVGQNANDCAAISRNSGGIFQIQSLNTNTGTQKASGLDMEATYDTDAAGVPLPLDIPGSISLDAQAEHQITNNQNTLGSISQFAGTYLGTSGYIQPKWKATLFTDYHLDQWTFHYDLQYIGGTNDAAGGTGFGFTLPDFVYHNISVSYVLPDIGPAKGALLSIGINNLLDKDPPFTVEDGVGKNNTISGPYDEVGRFFYSRISIKF